MIAVSHPGKIGDALWALPTIKWLCEKHGCQADFFTSPYCAPMLSLVAYQPYIRTAQVMPGYVAVAYAPGVQPWDMGLSLDGYDAVYELGFRGHPRCDLGNYIASLVGAPAELPVEYEFPRGHVDVKAPYYVLAPRGDAMFSPLYTEFMNRSEIPVVQLGSAGEAIEGTSIDRTGLSMLDTLAWIEGSEGYIGPASSHLVLANGFRVPKVVTLPGHGLETSNLRTRPGTSYIRAEKASDISRSLGMGRVYSRTLPLDREDLAPEALHIHNIRTALNGITHRFEHPLREWEYSQAVFALRTKDVRTVLDVGGGGSAFAPAMVWLHADLTQIDPGDCKGWSDAQAATIGAAERMRYIQEFFPGGDLSELAEGYDAVTCLSVIEHVPEHEEFFDKLLDYVNPGGLLVLTTDFHPDASIQVGGHLRTYNAEGMQRYIDQADAKGFRLYGGETDYTWNGPNVNSYTFASLVLERDLI